MTDPAESDIQPVYDITRSQAFGPNRRFIQAELDLALNDLRTIYRFLPKHAKLRVVRIADRLKAICTRFDNA